MKRLPTHHMKMMKTDEKYRLKNTPIWIFDLDNTLYPAANDLFAQVDVKIRDYVAEHLSMEKDDAYRLQKKYFADYGTTMRGLMDNHGVDPIHYMDFVHDIDLTPVEDNPVMEGALQQLPGKKYIFTNASTSHAERVMAKLGVSHHFEGIFDIINADYIPKPALQTYHKMLQRHDLDPKQAIMVEDIAKNLVPAAELGMTTLWVQTDTHWGREGAEGDYIDYSTDNLTAWLDTVAE
ncbi:MAG: pyrimidine 5'-nucleotidase [Rhodospirillales bacterium]|nr:pyrimidine 5'-nucleotidase [Rhodospirillales bacterium]